MTAGCTSAYFGNLTDTASRCQAARELCATSFVNYHAMHYCTFQENVWFTFPILTVLTIIKFNIVSHISDDYTSLAIAKISKYLKLSEAIAGATLLAFANGVPDVLTVIISSLSTTSPDASLAIGALFGANVFACTVVLAVTILASKGKTIAGLERTNILWDLAFFVLGISLFVLLGSLKYAMFITGIGLFLIYVLYLVNLWLSTRRNENKKQNKKATILMEGQELNSKPGDNLSVESDGNKTQASVYSDESVLAEDQDDFTKMSPGEVYLKLKKRTFNNWASMNCFWKMFYIFEWPIQFIV